MSVLKSLYTFIILLRLSLYDGVGKQNIHVHTLHLIDTYMSIIRQINIQIMYTNGGIKVQKCESCLAYSVCCVYN